MTTNEARIARKRESILASIADLRRRQADNCPDFEIEMAALRANLARLDSGKGLLGHFVRVQP